MTRRILIVKGSLTLRRMLTQAIAQQTGLEIDALKTQERLTTASEKSSSSPCRMLALAKQSRC